jgi:hypothetical protein
LVLGSCAFWFEEDCLLQYVGGYVEVVHGGGAGAHVGVVTGPAQTRRKVWRHSMEWRWVEQVGSFLKILIIFVFHLEKFLFHMETCNLSLGIFNLISKSLNSFLSFSVASSKQGNLSTPFLSLMKVFGSVSREPYKSLSRLSLSVCPCLSSVTNFEACDWSMRISLVISLWLSLVRIRVLCKCTVLLSLAQFHFGQHQSHVCTKTLKQ